MNIMSTISSLFSSHAMSETDSRIMSGKPIPASTSPVVEVLIGGEQSGLCTGSLLSKNKVLTAAHCAAPASKMSVIVGGERIGVKTVTVHPDARVDAKKGVLYNDVAILGLKSNAKAPTLPILTSKKVQEGDAVTISGFGLDEKHAVGTLKQGQTTVSSVDSNFVTTVYKKPGSNTCNGDSGGPAVMSYQKDGQTVSGLVGVTSTGEIAGCTIGDHTNFVNLQNKKVIDFIKANVAGLETK